jgi:DNA-binding transcriptional MerR regulator
MLTDTDIANFSERSLQTRHLAGLGLSTRQVHVWCEQISLGETGREDGKWRLFSPTDAMLIFIMRDLKARTDVALAKQKDLVAFLKSPDRFVLPALGLWTSAKTPILITDFGSDHGLLGASEGGIVVAVNRLSPLLVMLNLDPLMERLEASIAAGGTDKQKALMQRMLGHREANIANTGTTKERHGQPTPIIRRSRLIQPDEAVEKLP